MRWTGHVAHMEEMRNIRTQIWTQDMKGRDNTENLGVDDKWSQGKKIKLKVKLSLCL